MKIQTKITLLLTLVTIIFINGLFFVRSYEQRREELIIKSRIHEKNTLFDRIIRFESASLELFAYDFSNHDDTIEIIRQPLNNSAIRSLENALPGFNVTALWIYDPDLKFIYTNNPFGVRGIEQLVQDRKLFTHMLMKRFFCHFFVDTPAGLLEIRTAPVQPSDDAQRTTKPQGFLFAGRLWSPEYIQDLSLLTESSLEIVPLMGGEALESSSYDRKSGMVQFFRVAYGWDKKPLRQLRIRSQALMTQEMQRVARNQLILIIAFVAAVIFLLSVLLILWVNLPLKRISASLHRENPALLKNLLHAKTEFGNLAQLMLRFFDQRDELRQEIIERAKTQDALRVALEESRRSEAETASLLGASRAVLEHNDFQEAAQSILQLSMKLSGADTGFIAELAGREHDHATLRVTSYVFPFSPAAPPVMPLSGIYEEACQTGKPCYLNNFYRDGQPGMLPLEHISIENILCVPLLINREPAALLVLANKPTGFTDNDIRMAAAFSELASVALLNSRTLESLEISEERFRSVVETARDAIISVKTDDQIVFWNRGAELMFGYTADEVLYRKATMLLPERYRRQFEQQAVPADLSIREVAGIRKDGTEFPMEVSQATWKTKEGTFYTAIIRDITERKRSEESLRSSEQRLRDIVENSLTGILIIQAGTVVFKNRQFDELFGAVTDRFSLATADTIYPDDRSRVRLFHDALSSGTVATMDVDFRFYPVGMPPDSAALRWVNCRGTVIEYQGAPALFLTMMDITRIMELEQLVRIQDKMASLGRVAAGIAHEIRNPLTGINSYVYMLQCFAEDHATTPEENIALREIVEALQAASNRIEAVIRRVMDFSKPSAPRLSPVCINRAVEEAIKLAAVTLRKSGVSIETKLETALPPCPADLSMLEQVLLNLLTNAAQAMTRWKGEKKIAVQTWQHEDGVAVAVADSGPGIALENRTKIFDPFFTTKSDGSGIGLSLCQRIITDHRGTLTVGTSRWGGAEFRIEIPLEQTQGKRFDVLHARKA